MKDWKDRLDALPPHLLAWTWTVLLLLQMALTFTAFSQPRYPALSAAGWAVWALGTLFAILPIFALRSRGKVPEGKSYMQTTALVDSGIYALARHPQAGTAGILLNLGLALIGQHWLVAVLGAVGMVLLYVDTFRADEACIEKFGEEYVRYMERVPRVNFVAGLLRLLVRKGAETREG